MTPCSGAGLSLPNPSNPVHSAGVLVEITAHAGVVCHNVPATVSGAADLGMLVLGASAWVGGAHGYLGGHWFGGVGQSMGAGFGVSKRFCCNRGHRRIRGLTLRVLLLRV